MLLRVVRVDGVCHVCADEEAASDGSVVVFFRHRARVRDDCLEDALSSLNEHVAVGTLRRRRTNLLVVKEHNHADFIVVLVARFVVRDQRVE